MPGGEAGSPSVVLADDDILLREGLVGLLERAGLPVLGQAGDPDELLALVERTGPAVALVDVRMPPSHTAEGLRAAETIRRSSPGTAVLVLSAYIEVEPAISLLGTGPGTGYLLKQRVTDVERLVDAIRRVAAGESVVDPDVVRELMLARRRTDPLEPLSPREREVLALMAEGRSNAGIARSLWLSEGTVEKHVRSILAKLELAGRTDGNRRVLAVLRYLESH